MKLILCISSLLFATSYASYMGEPVNLARYGYLVKVLSREIGTENATTCTGTLVTPSTVLTSKKCFMDHKKSEYEAMAIISMMGTKKTMKKAMLDIRVEGDVALMRIDTVKTQLCPKKPAPARVSKLTFKPSLMQRGWNPVKATELLKVPCRLLSFKTSEDAEDFPITSEAQIVEVMLEKMSDKYFVASVNATAAGTACWDDIGAPLECSLNTENNWYQVGILSSIYADSVDKDFELLTATCDDITSMRFSVFTDDVVGNSLQAVDSVGLTAITQKCQFA